MPLAEKIGVPANVILAAVVLLVLFGGADLGSATTAVAVETESGETVQRAVAKPEYRKRTALSRFDRGSGLDTDEVWLTYMAPLALELDLAVDDFFDPIPVSEFNRYLSEFELPASGDVPLALKRDVAEQFRATFIAAGVVDRVGDEYRVTLMLHNAENGSLVSETVHQGPDFLALIDQMSDTLAEALDIPDRDEIDDLPVRQRLTEDEAAFEAFGRAYAKLLSDPPDLDRALEGLSAAVVLDPTFAMAQYRRSLVFLDANRPDEAVAAMQAAIDHVYRLPERLRFQAKADYYFLTDQQELGFAVIEMWVALHPEDPAALSQYALVQWLRGEREELIQTYRTLHRLSPADHSLLKALARVHEALGEADQALAALALYVERSPEDYTGYMEIARIQRRRGAHGTAREHLERAVVVEPLNPEPVNALASLDLDLGRFEEALAGYERAQRLARAPRQRAAALDELREYYRFRGQMEDAIRTAEAWRAEASGVYSPLQIAQHRFTDIDVYLEAGRYNDAVNLFEELRDPPPASDWFVRRWELRIAIGAGKSAVARDAYRDALESIEAAGADGIRPALIGDLGRIEEIEGEYGLALRHYREAMAEDPSLNFHRRIGRVLRKAGRLKEAEEELREALRLRPADPRAQLELARALRARGDTAGARERLGGALAAWETADESYEPAREARAMLAARVSG